MSTRISRTGCDLQPAETTTTTAVINTDCPHATGVNVFSRETDRNEFSEGGYRYSRRRVDNDALDHDHDHDHDRIDAKDALQHHAYRMDTSDMNKGNTRSQGPSPTRPSRGADDNLDCWFGHFGIVLPEDPFNVGDIDRLLDDYRANRNLEFTKIWAPSHRGFTAGYFLEDATKRLENELLALKSGGKVKALFLIALFSPAQPLSLSTYPPTKLKTSPLFFSRYVYFSS